MNKSKFGEDAVIRGQEEQFYCFRLQRFLTACLLEMCAAMSISSQDNCTPQCDDTWLCFGQHTGDSGKINLLLSFIEATRLVKLREMDALITSRLRLFLRIKGVMARSSGTQILGPYIPNLKGKI